jgi:hypothetical protein
VTGVSKKNYPQIAQITQMNPEEDAAIVYNVAAQILFKAFARLNDV